MAITVELVTGIMMLKRKPAAKLFDLIKSHFKLQAGSTTKMAVQRKQLKDLANFHRLF